MARGKRCGRRRTGRKRRSAGTTHRRRRTGGLSASMARRTGGLGLLRKIPIVGGILSTAVDILN